MFCNESEVLYFRYYRTFEGSLAPVDVARRNGRAVPRFHPSVTDHSTSSDEESAEYQELVNEVCQHLNEVEQRTWLRIIDGRSILDIASEEGVSRPAIYDRIKRMVAKNEYCAIWWRLKNKVNQHK